MSLDAPHLVGLDDEKLISILIELQTPLEVCQLASNPELRERINSPAVSMVLLEHFFACPLDVLKATYGMLGSPDLLSSNEED